jgi:hypothetical protein
MSTETLIRAASAIRTAQDYVKFPGYNNLIESEPNKTSKNYINEKDFWNDVLAYGKVGYKMCAGDKINLLGFSLSSWVPRVPGLYWKSESKRLRAAAYNEKISENIYTPLGKSLFVMGGVGNVRLLPTVSSCFLCASSSGYYWQGIPVLLQGEAFNVFKKVPSGVKTNISGIWSPMPREYAQGMGGDAGIPRFCLVVSQPDDITPLAESVDGHAAAWTLCEHRDENERIIYNFIYCTFEIPRSKLLNQAIQNDSFITNEAVWFLKNYMKEFHGQAMTDFDEEVPNFGALLPVKELMNPLVDSRKIRSFIDHIKKQVLSRDRVSYDEIPNMLINNFNIEELRTLTLDYLALDINNLIGPRAGKAEQVDEIITYCEQQDKMEDLAIAIIQERPQLIHYFEMPH